MSTYEQFRKDFTIFSGAHSSGLIYFDNAATSQRPDCVVEAEAAFYRESNANPLRGLYDLCMRATDIYENAREAAARFVNAQSGSEIIFTRNATEGLNLAAYSYGLHTVKSGDEIAVSCMEHHSNLLPWQMVCREKGARLVWLECDPQGVIQPEEYKAKITARTKIVAIAHVSNVLGVTNPVKEIAGYAHKAGDGGKGAVVVVDGAQSAPHMKVDVQDLGADFFAFSGHKLCAPMGIGVLYGRRGLLEQMEPFLRGGEMIEYVSREDATYAEIPHKFEAGTVNAGGAAGLAKAIEYIQGVGLENIRKNDDELAGLIMDGMKKIPHVHILGSSDSRKHCGIVTFTVDGVHPHDIASILNTENIAVRAGHHCAQPLMEQLGIGSAARASCYFYNTPQEAERFVQAVSRIRQWMGYTD